MIKDLKFLNTNVYVMSGLLLFFIIVLSSVFSSCIKGKLIEEYYFTEEMHTQIPFEGFESLIYINADSVNIELSGGARTNRVTKVTECVNCSDYYYFETDYIKFRNDSYILNLYMEATQIYRFTISFTIDEKSFISNFYDNLPLSNANLKGEQVFYDSIFVNNTNYYNVFGDTLIHYDGVISIDPFPVFCYYSTEYGVIKIDFSDNTSWQLEKIEW